MFFCMIIFCMCDLHLKLNFLNLMNIKTSQNDLIEESFLLQPFFSKFQDFEIFI